MICRRFRKRNKGSTLIEMLVCFLLLAVFMSAAAVVISNITNIYFDVQGQTSGRQLANILLEKICGEIEGAKISKDDTYTWPVIYRDPADAQANNLSGFKIDLYDRTDTHIQMYAEEGELKIRYFEINPDKEDSSETYKEAHRDETIWTFDANVYQDYRLSSLRFVPANKGYVNAVSDNTALEDLARGIMRSGTDVETAPEMADYPGNVVGVYLTLDSSRYGKFYAYKYVKMYNISDEDAQSFAVQFLTTTDYDR
ncbi:MAG: prepilin-type N-terminal cleavage/methylation domain-containing protein [Lachnospiraceae bacterium]|nr:prepilin-type N-terminal cleavage/methylation domain-containing protein [Lachnospiraceae bacterium]